MKSLPKICLLAFHKCVNYCNITWVSATKTQLRTILMKQKHAIRIIYHENKYAHSKHLMKDIKALNVYQINISEVLKIVHKAKK